MAPALNDRTDELMFESKAKRKRKKKNASINPFATIHATGGQTMAQEQLLEKQKKKRAKPEPEKCFTLQSFKQMSDLQTQRYRLQQQIALLRSQYRFDLYPTLPAPLAIVEIQSNLFLATDPGAISELLIKYNLNSLFINTLSLLTTVEMSGWKRPKRCVASFCDPIIFIDLQRISILQNELYVPLFFRSADFIYAVLFCVRDLIASSSNLKTFFDPQLSRSLSFATQLLSITWKLFLARDKPGCEAPLLVHTGLKMQTTMKANLLKYVVSMKERSQTLMTSCSNPSVCT